MNYVTTEFYIIPHYTIIREHNQVLSSMHHVINDPRDNKKDWPGYRSTWSSHHFKYTWTFFSILINSSQTFSFLAVQDTRYVIVSCCFIWILT